MARKILIAVFSLNILVSLALLAVYLFNAITQVDSFALLLLSGYFLSFAVIFFVIPSIFFWALYLLLSGKRLKEDPAVRFSLKLFLMAVGVHLAVLFFVVVNSNTIEITVANYSQYPLTELSIDARNDERFMVDEVEPGRKEEFRCNCGRIEYPDDEGIAIAFEVNGRRIQHFIVGRFSPTHDGQIEVRVLNDSTVYKSVEHSSQRYWTELGKFAGPLLKWEEIVKEEQPSITTLKD